MAASPKIPSVLVELGRAVELKTVDELIKWPKTANAKLFANESGRRLYILKTPKRSTASSRYRKDAARLWRSWSGFSVDSSSIYKFTTPALVSQSRAEYIVYESDKFDGKKKQYIHHFDYPPIVWRTKRNKNTVVLTGGKMRITSAGIEG